MPFSFYIFVKLINCIKVSSINLCFDTTRILPKHKKFRMFFAVNFVMFRLVSMHGKMTSFVIREVSIQYHQSYHHEPFSIKLLCDIRFVRVTELLSLKTLAILWVFSIILWVNYGYLQHL